ncbi:PHD finger protein MALE STERILITY 1 [Acorus calamus]|uniref:PHD finger protein MALE STERILITY 1 n=1 Tax=Acorus calamus TaxID=4465 RepID=A0AAV9ELG3_ACOCL|nr:PHD finger protein MALE STERILITY 1 [Acorus calamus]
MHNNVGCCKKRTRGERVFKFKSFGHPGHPAADFDGSFHRNVRALLEFGHPEPSLLGGGFPCWSFQLEIHGNPPVIIYLYIVEERIESSSRRHCHHCWGHHMICNERFHFVLPSHKTMPALLVKPDFDRDRRRNSKATPTGLDFLDHDGHLMHGIVHSNGFGHLLRVNGFEGGSEFVSGHRIMDLWDRLCTGLKARKVSLTDVAKKASMELRLVHGIAYGEPWFGHWGYKFGRGSYGVTLQSYQKSIEVVRDLPLSLLAHNNNLRRADLAQTPIILSKYQTITAQPMHNLAQLLRCMLELKHRLPPDLIKFMDYHAISTEPACRWSPKRVEMAARVIVESLKKARFKWVSRQEVRDAARIYIGDTGLLDFVLKSLGDHVVGNHMVRRTVNPATKVLEYCLEDVAADARAHTCSARAAAKFGFKFTRAQLAKDIAHVYNRALCERGVAAAVQAILDAKHFVKDFQREPREGHVKAVEETAEGVVVEGRAAAEEAEMVEGGDDERYVQCACGARGDDGERMIGCDVCDVWQHTRCVATSKIKVSSISK